MHSAFKTALYTLLAVICLNTSSFAQQKIVSERTHTWLQYFLNLKLYKKWSVHFDGGYRSQNDFIKNPHQWLVRIGGVHHFNPDTYLTAGMAYFSHFTRNTSKNYFRSEYRPYMRLTCINKVNRMQIQHRYRGELRNIQKGSKDGKLNDYLTYVRLGYQINFQYPLIGDSFGEGVPYLILYDELFVNFGKQAQNNFDQNRACLGLGYGLTKNLTMSIGYQYIYVQRNRDNFENVHSIRLNFIHNINLKLDEVE